MAIDPITAGTAAASLGINLAGGIGAKKRQREAFEMQLENQMRLNQQAGKLSYEFGEQAANNAFQRQMQMYQQQLKDNREWDNETSAMKRRMAAIKSVGGNPMMAIMGDVNPGSGGSAEFATAPQGGGGAGIMAGNAPSGVDWEDARTRRNQAISESLMMGKQLQLMDAQIENVGADTQKKGAETENLGADTANKQIQLEQIFAGIENTKVQTAATELGMSLDQQRLELDKGLTGANIEQINANTEKIGEEAHYLTQQIRIAKIQGNLDEQTLQTKVSQLKGELANTMKQGVILEVEARAKEAGINLTEKQIEKIGNDIDIAWDDLEFREMVANDEFYQNLWDGMAFKHVKPFSKKLEQLTGGEYGTNRYQGNNGKNKLYNEPIKLQYNQIDYNKYHR